MYDNGCMIILKNLSHSFGERELFCINGTFSDGIHMIEGASGSGKSTLLKILIGELLPSGGTFAYEGCKEGEIPWSRIAYLPSEGLLLNDLTFWQNVSFFDDVFQKDKAEDAYFSELLEAFEIDHLSDTPLNLLSGGERKALNLIFVLGRDVEFLFLDEPFAELSEERKNALIGCLNDISEERCILLTNHNAELSALHYREKLFFSGEKIELEEAESTRASAPDEERKLSYIPLLKRVWKEHRLLSDLFHLPACCRHDRRNAAVAESADGGGTPDLCTG